MKKVYLIHGWDGNPNNNWFPDTTKTLQDSGFLVNSVILPTPENPDPITWPQAMVEQIENPDEETYFVGHSIGCITILRYLQGLAINSKLGGIVLVAPYLDLTHLQTQEEKVLWNKWKNLPLNLETIKNKVNQVVCIFSDNDEDVDLEPNMTIFKEKLNAQIIIEHNKGHFSDHDGVVDLPSVVEAILSFK